MTALSASRTPEQIKGHLVSLPVAASVLIYAGALVMMDSSGNAKPATAATGLVAIGVADGYVDNSSGSAGDVDVTIRTGIFAFKNSGGGDAIAADDAGKICYAVDDQTVALTNNAGARSPAGRIVGMSDSGEVFVAVGMPAAPGADSIGGRDRIALTVDVATLVGTNTYRVACPVAGKVTKIYSVTKGALTTGDATLTGKIGTTAITSGALTITQSGSAAGDVDSATPSALNTVAAGDFLAVTVGGTNDAVVGATVTFLIELTP